MEENIWGYEVFTNVGKKVTRKKSHRKKVTGNKVTRKKVIIPRYICQPGSDTKMVLGKKVTGKMSQ